MKTNVPRLPVIDSTRLQLRPLVVADAEALHQAYGDPEAMRFWDFPASVDLARTAKRIEQSLGVSPEWHAAWGVVLKRDPPTLVGMVNALRHYFSATGYVFRTIEIRYRFVHLLEARCTSKERS